MGFFNIFSIYFGALTRISKRGIATFSNMKPAPPVHYLPASQLQNSETLYRSPLHLMILLKVIVPFFQYVSYALSFLSSYIICIFCPFIFSLFPTPPPKLSPNPIFFFKCN